ncbi:hypothetical protein J2T18_002471 [Paenibacillus polymyxa]|uniref:hypothetical protein n=1 Tax=Paenibacillus polymyxa TaxID=1406 RepID=UPI00278CEB24|nr:hypothetical protein [Paenibacillus polymyxa]MDQ0048188.1 hypothetical protein [Paenibacillus polymyxa]
MKNIATILVIGFFTGILTIYILNGKVELNGLLVCFLSAGIVTLGFLAVYLIKKCVKNEHTLK